LIATIVIGFHFFGPVGNSRKYGGKSDRDTAIARLHLK
jgi:hypothetical protein